MVFTNFHMKMYNLINEMGAVNLKKPLSNTVKVQRPRADVIKLFLRPYFKNVCNKPEYLSSLVSCFQLGPEPTQVAERCSTLR